MGDDLIQAQWKWAEEFGKGGGRPLRAFKIDKATSALVVIDMQKGFIAPAEHYGLEAAKELVGNINKLARACRSAGIPVIWVVTKANSEVEWGLTCVIQPDSCFKELLWDSDMTKIWQELVVDTERDHEVVKRRYSALIPGSSNLERLLRTLGRDTLIITGIATNVCVATTAMDAMMLDFKVILVSDGSKAFTDFFQQATLMNFKMVFGDVVPTAEILKEIEQAA